MNKEDVIMAQNHYLAGVGTALLFKGNDLIGVVK